jgi:hypothetical protein
MTDVFHDVKVGHAHFSFSLYFYFLLIGWATIVLHAAKFHQPTYDLTQNKPTPLWFLVSFHHNIYLSF